MSITSCYVHIVFATKNREGTLTPSKAPILYKFIWSTLEKMKCTLVRINGMPDHIHMLIILNPKVALSDVVRKVKAESSGFIHNEGVFPMFDSWGKGYYAVSVSFSNRDSVINYIKNQQVHHAGIDFANELNRLYEALGEKLYPTDLM